MAKWVYIENIGEHLAEEITIKGWVYNKRSSGKIRFLLVRDGTGLIQCVVSRENKDDPIFETFDSLTQESSLIVTGKPREDKRAPGGYELEVSDIKIIQIADEYPITPKEHGIAFLMNHRHLWLRSSRQHAVLRIRATIIKAIKDFFDGNGFILLDTPILTPAACEGTTTLFETNYFDEKAFLTQSGQLYNEANAMAFGKVYCFGPTFRAERSKTRRHLMEFWMAEPEIAYADLEYIINLGEDLIVYIVEKVLEKNKKELETLNRDTKKLEIIKKPFPKIRYDDAVEILHKKGSGIKWGDDLGGDEETIISESFEKPVVITHYPAKIKAFYMEPDSERPDLALCMDMLAPEGYGEIIGGSQRIHDKNVLLKRMEEFNLPRENYEWYIDLRRFGSVPHAGFGLGLERTVAWICKIEHIRETIPYPRLLYRIYP
ncbi:MAG: asparagine--tRNA ligase [Acidobacteriota bacterium]